VRIVVDRGACSGHGRCASVAPEVYELDADGYNTMGTFEVRADLEAKARSGADSCPERAITVAE
jgi:ferredoxin